MIAEGVIKQIAEMVGKENVLQGKAALEKNFPRMGDRPQLVLVRPRDEYDLAEVADLATQKNIPMYTLRRDKMDPALADKEGILIDVSRMTEIKLIDRRNLTANIGTGVTFEQLIPECLKNDCKLLLPLAATSHQVARTYLDRDALMGCSGFRAPQLTIFHAVLSDGRIWVSGAQQMTEEGMCDFREDQGPQFSLSSSGRARTSTAYPSTASSIPTRCARRARCSSSPSTTFNRPRIWPTRWPGKSTASRPSPPTRGTSRCFFPKARAEAEALVAKLPPWLTVVTNEHHQELVDMWSNFAADDAAKLGGKPVEGELVGLIDKQLQKPWYVSDRDYFKGDTKHVFSYDFYSRVPELAKDVAAVAEKNGFAASDLGQIIVPVYYGGSAYIESDIYFNPSENDKAEKARLDAFKLLIDKKSFVDKPLGKVADIIYGQADAGYLNTIKLFKKIVDPSGILNPEQLLEGV